MAVQTLVTADLETSRKIVENIEANGVQIAVAFWAILEEYGDWRLFLAAPRLDSLGLFRAYGQLAEAGLPQEVFNEPIIVILHMNDPLVVGLLSRYRGKDVRGHRLAGQVFGARAIEEGILERVA